MAVFNCTTCGWKYEHYVTQVFKRTILQRLDHCAKCDKLRTFSFVSHSGMIGSNLNQPVGWPLPSAATLFFRKTQDLGPEYHDLMQEDAELERIRVDFERRKLDEAIKKNVRDEKVMQDIERGYLVARLRLLYKLGYSDEMIKKLQQEVADNMKKRKDVGDSPVEPKQEIVPHEMDPDFGEELSKTLAAAVAAEIEAIGHIHQLRRMWSTEGHKVVGSPFPLTEEYNDALEEGQVALAIKEGEKEIPETLRDSHATIARVKAHPDDSIARLRSIVRMRLARRAFLRGLKDALPELRKVWHEQGKSPVPVDFDPQITRIEKGFVTRQRRRLLRSVQENYVAKLVVQGSKVPDGMKGMSLEEARPLAAEYDELLEKAQSLAASLEGEGDANAAEANEEL